MNIKYIIPLLLLLLFGVGCKGTNPKKEIDKEKISSLLDQGSVKIIDVRTIEEYEEEHIPGAINYPIESLKDSLIYLDKSEDIIVVCRTGNKSSKAERLLIENGFEKVYDGGKWQNVDEIIKEKQKYKTGNN